LPAQGPRIKPHKPVKGSLPLLVRDAFAVIFHHNAHPTAAFLARHAHGGRRIAHGIGQQVSHRTTQQVAIGTHHQRRNARHVHVHAFVARHMRDLLKQQIR